MQELRSNNHRIGHITVVLCAAVFLLSLVPIAMVAPYVRSTGDDLNYSAVVHRVLENGGGLREVLQTIVSQCISVWDSWQGTWSSVALFSLQPGIWGNAWYPLTIVVAIVCITVGTGYLLHVISDLLGIRPVGFWCVSLLMLTVLIQYLPNAKCGIFWWTSVAHYVIPYGVTMMCMGWSLRWLQRGSVRYLIGMILGMSYLGGAGYPEVVLGAVCFCLVMLAGLVFGGSRQTTAEEINKTPSQEAAAQKQRTRAVILLVPLLLEMAGFAVSAAAPGNKARGGSDFGFSVSRVISTLAGCVADGILGTAQDMIRVRVYLLLLLAVAILVYVYYDAERAVIRVRHPLLLTLAGVILICIIRAPERYAGTEVSGGVPDSYWMISLTVVTVLVMTWTIRLRDVLDAAGEPRGWFSFCRREAAPLLVIAAMLVLCLIGYRHIIGESADYICMEFRSSGALADYHEQMEEWLALLEDPDTDEVVLPAMNDEQGPFMLMVPLNTADAWTSQVYAKYYGKSSVICVPRENYQR